MIRTLRFVPYLTLLAFLVFSGEPAVAAEIRTSPEQASKFIQDLGGRAVTLLASYDKADTPQTHAQFSDLVREGFDLDTIGRFVLGTTWQRATLAQQQEFQKLFAVWTINSYARRLRANRGGSLMVIGSQPIAGTDALVETRIHRTDGMAVRVDLRVRNTQGRMKIIDVSMGGVSMGVTQRDEFASVIQHDGLDGLIGNLRGRVATLQAGTALQ